MPAEFHLFSVTAIIMAWQKFLPLSLSASLHPSIFTTIFVPVCFNIVIAWYHCCIHAFVTDLPHNILLHASIVMFFDVHSCIETDKDVYCHIMNLTDH